MSSVKEGESVELIAQVKDIADGNTVTFQVWKEGQDPAGADIPYAQLVATIEGGAATATWMYTFEGDVLPKEDPKFFFTVHSAWCPCKKSESLTEELLRPELSDAKWGVTEALVGEELTLSVSAAEFEEGKGVTFNIFKEGANTKTDQPVKTIGADIEGGKAETVWILTDVREEGDTADSKYIFTVTADKAEEVESSAVAVTPPKLSEPEWKDGGGDEITKGIVEHILKLSVKCDDVLEGGYVNFKIFYEGADTKTDAPIRELQAQNEEGIAEVSWNCPNSIFNSHNEKTGEKSVKLIFICKYREIETEQSSSIELFYADCWKMMDDGTLVYNGKGWLKDQDGNPVRNEKGNKIGAEGIERGLLNILFGRNYPNDGNNESYDMFSDPEKDMVQKIMKNSGLKCSDGDDPNDWMWGGENLPNSSIYDLTAYNMEKALNMESMMINIEGTTIATQVFARYFFNRNPVVLSEVGDRLDNYRNALETFYSSGKEQVDKFNNRFPRTTQKYGYDSTYPGAAKVHKGHDTSIPKGKGSPAGMDLFTQYSGKIVARDDSDSGNAGNDIRIELGFMFEESLISTSVKHSTFHMQSIADGITVGKFYESGTLIGKVGNTDGGSGISSGAHVHNEMIVLFTEKVFRQKNILRTKNTLFTDSFLEGKIGASPLNLFVTNPSDVMNNATFYFDEWKKTYIGLNNLYGE